MSAIRIPVMDEHGFPRTSRLVMGEPARARVTFDGTYPGAMVQPEPGLSRIEAVCRECGATIRRNTNGTYGHVVAVRVGALHPRHAARPKR